MENIVEMTIQNKKKIPDLVQKIKNFLNEEMGPFSRIIEKDVYYYFYNDVYISLKSNTGIDKHYLKLLLKKCKKYVKNVGKQ